MSDEAALLRAIYANCDDDTPRLVFADWLDEHDQPERAEFIRVQIELERKGNHDDSGKLQKRERELFESNYARWTASLGRFNREKCHVSFTRGFPDYLTLRNCKPAELRIVSRIPNLRCLDIGASTLTLARVREIVAQKNLEYLNISDTPLLRNWCALFESLPCWTKIRISPTDQEIPNEFHERRIAKLSRLDSGERRKAALKYLRYSDSDVTSLTQTGIKRVVLNQDRVCDAELRLLAEVPELEEIHNSEGIITTGGLEYIAHLPKLTALELFYVPVTSLTPLVRCTALQKLQLYPHTDATTHEEATEGLEHLSHLRELMLRGDYYGERTAQRLASLRNLRSLDIDFTLAAEEHLASLSNLKLLESLTLNGREYTGVRVRKFLKSLR